MHRFAIMSLLLVVCLAMGCTSIPPREDPAMWQQVELGPEITGEWFADTADFILRFRFEQRIEKVLAFRAVDLPGNGFDLYTLEGVILKRLSEKSFEMKLPRHYQLDHQLFFRLEWKASKNDWPRSRLFLLKSGALYYSEN